MSDFEDKLNAILSNPEAIAQVMGLAQSLNAGGAFSSAREDTESTPQPHASPQSASGDGSEAFFGLDPKLMERLLPLLGELSQDNSDERLQLLYALRPFLKPERRDKIERAIKTAKLIRIGKKFLTSMGEPHV